MISDFRGKVFDFLCSNSTPDFNRYLRTYEKLSGPKREFFEISCELVGSARADSMRVAITYLRQKDVLGWLSACGFQIPSVEKLLGGNEKDDCFGIGLADYPPGAGACRIKLYNNFEGTSYAGRVDHVRQLLTLLNIPEEGFKRDFRTFKRADTMSVDWDGRQADIKVYWGPFRPEDFLRGFPEVLFKDEILCYDILRREDLLPEAFFMVVRYSSQGRSQRTDLRLRTRKIVPYLKMFDRQKQASRFFSNLYRSFPDLRLEFISLQWAPVQRTQFYFVVGEDHAGRGLEK